MSPPKQFFHEQPINGLGGLDAAQERLAELAIGMASPELTPGEAPTTKPASSEIKPSEQLQQLYEQTHPEEDSARLHEPVDAWEDIGGHRGPMPVPGDPEISDVKRFVRGKGTILTHRVELGGKVQYVPTLRGDRRDQFGIDQAIKELRRGIGKPVSVETQAPNPSSSRSNKAAS